MRQASSRSMRHMTATCMPHALMVAGRVLARMGLVCLLMHARLWVCACTGRCSLANSRVCSTLPPRLACPSRPSCCSHPPSPLGRWHD